MHVISIPQCNAADASKKFVTQIPIEEEENGEVERHCDGQWKYADCRIVDYV